MKIVFLFICLCSIAMGCAVNQKVSAKTSYVWNEVTRQAQFPQSYNYPVYIVNGEIWQEQSAPWSPRGGSVVWVFDNKLFMTGGKYSFTEKGEITFVYSNDVWALSKKTE